MAARTSMPPGGASAPRSPHERTLEHPREALREIRRHAPARPHGVRRHEHPQRTPPGAAVRGVAAGEVTSSTALSGNCAAASWVGSGG